MENNESKNLRPIIMLQQYLRMPGRSQARLAELMGVTQPTIHRWVTGKAKIPPEKCALLSGITCISKNQLRPDVF